MTRANHVCIMCASVGGFATKERCDEVNEHARQRALEIVAESRDSTEVTSRSDRAENLAFRLGHRHGRWGFEVTECPYAPADLSPEARAWRKGWTAGAALLHRHS